MRNRIQKISNWLFLTLLILGLICVYYFHWYEYLNYESLNKYHASLQAWTKQNYAEVVLSFMVIYTLLVALSVPGAVFVTLAGGFLFGPVATFYVVVSATVGATIIFLAVRSTLGDWLANAYRSKNWFNKMEKGFQENAFSYLLFLRLVPVFPFWLINIVAGLLNVSFKIFVIATFIGIIPGAFIYVMIGNSLNYLFATNQTPDLNIIFKPQILLPLLGLAVLVLLPILFKGRKRK